MSLFRFELKKLLINKRMLIMLSVLFVLYAVFGFANNYVNFGSQGNYTVYRELADAYTGPIDAEQASISTAASAATKELVGNNSESLSEITASDPNLKFNLHYADYAAYVDEYYNGASTDAKNNPYGIYPMQEKIDSLAQNGDTSSFEYRKTVQQLETAIALEEPVFANTSMWDILFDLWGSYITIILLFMPLAFIIAPVFSVEASTGMDNLVLSAKYGRKKIVTAKLASVVITSVVLVLIYLVSTFFSNFFAVGSMAGASAALRSIAAYVRAPFAMSIWQYAIVSAAWLLYMGIVFGIVMTFISSKMKNQMATFGTGLTVLFAGLVLGLLGSNVPAFVKILVDFWFTNIFQAVDIFGAFSVYNVFGIIVPYWAAALILMAVLCSIGTWAIYIFQKKRTVA